MTDREEIIKALECCASDNGIGACESGCPLWEIEPCPCIDEPNEILHCALALINQLTEENERLQKALNTDISIVRVSRGSGKTAYLREVGRIKVDAIKADTVNKMRSEIEARCIKGGIYPAFVKSTIDQIAKEMLEGDR